MASKIDISVIIPLYNAEKYIERAVASVTLQQPHNLTYEIIVVDDVSTDNSRIVVQQLKNENIKLIELKKNAGTANARNVGISNAKGEWIQFLDSDDYVSNDLYLKFEKAKRPDVNCYLFSVIYEFNDYNLKQTITHINDKRAFGHYGSVWNKFIKRELCIPFKTNFSFEDVCFIIDMMIEKDLKILLIENAYYYYNCRNDHSKMANFNTTEFRKMFNYVFGRIKSSDALTKMFILEIFTAILFNKQRPFMMSLPIAARTLTRLFKYLPRVYRNQNRKCILSTKMQ